MSIRKLYFSVQYIILFYHRFRVPSLLRHQTVPWATNIIIHFAALNLQCVNNNNCIRSYALRHRNCLHARLLRACNNNGSASNTRRSKNKPEKLSLGR